MHDRYAGVWFHTLTFTQKTLTRSPADTMVTEMWKEMFMLPGRMRAEISHPDGTVTYILNDGSSYLHFMPGDSAKHTRAGNLLLTIAYDVYAQPVDRTIADLRDEKLNLAPVHEDIWGGRPMYVIGAAAGDAHSRQLWIDKERLVFVRSLAPAPGDTSKTVETRFENFQHRPDGSWFSERVEFYGPDGRLRLSEEYTDVKFNVPLDTRLFAIPPA
jgi:hypothetical protein